MTAREFRRIIAGHDGDTSTLATPVPTPAELVTLRQNAGLSVEDVHYLLGVNRGAPGWLVGQWEAGQGVNPADLSTSDGRHTVTGTGGGNDGLLSVRRLYGLLSAGNKLDGGEYPALFFD